MNNDRLKDTQRRNYGFIGGTVAVLIFLLALALRVWQADMGLPRDYVPDEANKIMTIAGLEENQFRHRESQPSFMYYSLYTILKVIDPLKPLIMHSTSFSHSFEGADADMAFMKWIGRLYMGLLGAFTCLVLYPLGKLLHGKSAGLIAEFILAVSPAAIALSHYLKEDSPLLLFVTLNVLCCVSLIKNGRKRDYIAAGLTGGLAFASKYPGAFTLLLIAGAIVIREWECLSRPGQRWEKTLHILSSLRTPFGVFILTFFAICPTYLNVFRLGSGLAFQTSYMLEGHHDGVSVSPLSNWFTFYVRRSLIPGLTIGLFVLSIPGIYLLWKKARQLAILPITWGFLYLFTAECLPSKPYPFFTRYIMPALPMFCLFCAVAIIEFTKIAMSYRQSGVMTGCVMTGAFLLLAWPLYISIRFLRSARPDTRDLASAWVNKHLPTGAVLMQTAPRYTGYYDTSRFKTAELNYSGHKSRRSLFAGRDVYGVVSGFAVDRFLDHKSSRSKAYEFWTKKIMRKDNLVAQFLPPVSSFGFHNPWIRIYRLAPVE